MFFPSPEANIGGVIKQRLIFYETGFHFQSTSQKSEIKALTGNLELIAITSGFFHEKSSFLAQIY